MRPSRLPCAALLVTVACGSGASNRPDAGDGLDPDAGSGADAPLPVIDAPIGSDAPTGTDPADDGPYLVTTQPVSIPGAAPGRTLPSTVFKPTGAPTPAAFVVISPGFQMARTQYTSYARHLATWGFVVALTDYADQSFFPAHQDLADDLAAVIDWGLGQASLAVDPARIAAAGHSLGGKLSVLAASDDPRIKAVVGWDPVDSNAPSVAPERMTNLTAAVAVIGETTNGSGGGMPCAPAADNFQTFYAAAPSPALEMTMTGADHMDWVDDPSCTFCGFCTPGTDAPAVTRTATRRLNVAWLRRQLDADSAMDPWLATPPEIGTGHATVVQK